MAYTEEKEAGEPAKKDDDEEILKDARDYLKECIDEESPERAKMQDDLRFCTLDQWPQEIRAERENDIENGPRPCLTIDKINQYIVQVLNDIRQGRPGINVRPQDDAADIETAKLIKGLVRNIEDQSKADIAYYVAAENAVKIGLGYFRITTKYVDDESFDQEISIDPIPNTFSVYLGKHLMPDGSDAEHGFIIESMPLAKFKEAYPKAKAAPGDFEGLDKASMGYWITDETITVVEYYCFKRVEQEMLFLDDGTTMPADMYAKWPKSAGEKPGVADRRRSVTKQLQWRKMTGVEVLDSRDLPGQYIPIVEMVGREAWVDGRRIVWGLVRPAKDSLRMYNYWASTITERMALAPKQPFIGFKGQFTDPKWAKANRVAYPYLEAELLEVNGNAVPLPQRQGATPLEAALLQQMQVIEHDVQTSLGMFKAATGESESQQSGRAILALQRESDTGTYHFGANLGMSIRHAGRIIVDLIPHYYDTKRIVRIMGEDGEVQTATLDPEAQVPYQKAGSAVIFNPGMGKYDVSISSGPSYNTKRMEAQATFVELAKGAADPASALLLRYLTVLNSDFTGADMAAKGFRALLPPPVIQAMTGDQQMDPVAQAVVAQAQQQMQMMAQELQEEQAGTKQAQMKIQADHDAKMKQLELDRQVEAEKAKLAREKAEAEFKLKKFQCEQEMELADMQAGAEHQREEKRMAMEQDKHMREAESERMERSKDEQAEVAPQFMQGMQQMMTMFAQALAQQQEANLKGLALIAEAIKNPAPRQVTLGGIKRTEAGITQATATIN